MLPVILISIFVMIFVIASAAVTAGSMLLERRRLPMTVERLGGASSDETPLLLQQQMLSTISIWQQLLTRFDFVEILMHISTRSSAQSEENLMRLFEIYAKTGSEVARDKLMERGLIAVPANPIALKKQ